MKETPFSPNFKIQWKPNLISKENRICLTRICWNHGIVGDGVGYSRKISISICWKLQDFWVGAFWLRGHYELFTWICFIPCVPIRIHSMTSYGGSFV